MLCECGCRQVISVKFKHQIRRRYIRGHNGKGVFLSPSEWKETQSESTSYHRARRLKNYNYCDISNDLCCGRIETAHLDHNPLNNDITNLIRFCRAHHVAYDKLRLDLETLRLWIPRWLWRQCIV